MTILKKEIWAILLALLFGVLFFAASGAFSQKGSEMVVIEVSNHG